MSEEPVKHEEGHSETGYERQDLGAKPIVLFLGGLALTCILVYFILRGMYAYLDARDRAKQPALNPMKPPPQALLRDEHASVVYQHIERTFPEPRLESDERTELHDFRMTEEQELNSYGWVDQKGGVVHIPIERAMQLIAQRGLPVLPESEAGAKTAESKPEKKKQ
ncbi:MAG TPA: hypothetical protein VLV49_03160 [Terriglobales bacterium]|nr:hypothetical protein [Terriglobales bacterium]